MLPLNLIRHLVVLVIRDRLKLILSADVSCKFSHWDNYHNNAMLIHYFNGFLLLVTYQKLNLIPFLLVL